MLVTFKGKNSNKLILCLLDTHLMVSLFTAPCRAWHVRPECFFVVWLTHVSARHCPIALWALLILIVEITDCCHCFRPSTSTMRSMRATKSKTSAKHAHILHTGDNARQYAFGLQFCLSSWWVSNPLERCLSVGKFDYHVFCFHVSLDEVRQF